jgi:hypothetical protein
LRESELGEAAEDDGDMGMVAAQCLLVDGEGALQKRLSLGVAALGQIELTKDVEG